ncbi:class I SAM-dependent RNA methyltransferase [Phytoactinopolyspora halophila]|uniref:class I SAM-dependent RNA methyltransferase n=1 Tax=Phytoactinopolyspora halophila TaxID=1981511 RepID=UPI001B8C7ECB|nr:class I SAM-dependent RNA methyltransferase [Phytoactinopolyspora halophila]
MPAAVEIIVDVTGVGHGGFGIARHDGRVVFVRHALPGERVRAHVTEGTEDSRYWRADAVEILTPSADRVEPPCPYAGPGKCGGCDWQHASLPAQRRLKADVIAEQLWRLAGIEWDVEVEPVPDEHDGLGWRTRMTYAVDEEDRAGLRRHRSHDVVPIDECAIAHPGIRSLQIEQRPWPGMESVQAAVSGTGERLVIAEPGQRDVDVPELPADVSVAMTDEHGKIRTVEGHAELTETAWGRTWQVSAGGFWQVHPGAADLLGEAVAQAVRPRPGERALDLYSGAGLFAAVLADGVGHDGSVVAIEGDRRAAADARNNLADLEQVTFRTGPVDRVLGKEDELGADVVVLDPPRAGAKLNVVHEIARRHPRAIAYVACDPAALGRDLATFATAGYRLSGLRAFDLFPMTHHVECVATIVPADEPAT